MNRQMLVSVICRHNGNYHRARAVVHYFATVSKALRLIMATSAPFPFLFVRQVFTLNKRNNGTESTWRETSDDSEAFGH